MSALSTITSPALHGRRSATRTSVEAAPRCEPANEAAPSPVAQPAAVETSGDSASSGDSAARPAGTFRRVAGKAFKGLGVGLLVIAALVFVFLAIGPRVLGYQTSTMLTGSMSPLINPGDVVVTVPTPVNDVKVGDIITYHIPVEDQRVETHRITEITTTADGGVAVQTKGDANNGIDPWIATLQGKTVDKQVATIPYVGNAIRALREPIVLNILMYGAPAILVIGMLASIWTKNPTDTSAKDAIEPQVATSE
ncbi:signal peptidase I [Paenarthrobacter ilicis]|uniref:Signal peptidase I n=1 Tax=Paenarthrobacter ilicis TaxID=43665 RepID=A0ABX0TJX4_9MICC|nr:signal peptidase I [Paenarthrobacter ilicis]MBM7794862.1 signal peptidase [Paenarthrobacter ilicis]NIJ02839.1 signal peptidase [Paenarthrobacter ilicis]